MKPPPATDCRPAKTAERSVCVHDASGLPGFGVMLTLPPGKFPFHLTYAAASRWRCRSRPAVKPNPVSSLLKWRRNTGPKARPTRKRPPAGISIPAESRRPAVAVGPNGECFSAKCKHSRRAVFRWAWRQLRPRGRGPAGGRANSTCCVSMQFLLHQRVTCRWVGRKARPDPPFALQRHRQGSQVGHFSIAAPFHVDVWRAIGLCRRRSCFASLQRCFARAGDELPTALDDWMENEKRGRGGLWLLSAGMMRLGSCYGTAGRTSAKNASTNRKSRAYATGL